MIGSAATPKQKQLQHQVLLSLTLLEQVSGSKYQWGGGSGSGGNRRRRCSSRDSSNNGQSPFLRIW